MTTGPSPGPASAYPTLSSPASICSKLSNEAFVPVFIVVTSVTIVVLDGSFEEFCLTSWPAWTPLSMRGSEGLQAERKVTPTAEEAHVAKNARRVIGRGTGCVFI